MVTRLRIGDLPPDQRPRERLQRIGGEALTDAEVVAILVGSGNSGANAIDVAQKALVQLGGIAGLIRADNDALQRVPGIGPSSAAKILTARSCIDGRNARNGLLPLARRLTSLNLSSQSSPATRTKESSL